MERGVGTVVVSIKRASADPVSVNVGLRGREGGEGRRAPAGCDVPAVGACNCYVLLGDYRCRGQLTPSCGVKMCCAQQRHVFAVMLPDDNCSK